MDIMEEIFEIRSCSLEILVNWYQNVHNLSYTVEAMAGLMLQLQRY